VIELITVKNLRGIRDGTLEGLTPLTVLVGPNGSGKSTILDALLIAGGRRPASSIGFVVERRAGLRYGARWLFWHGSDAERAEISAKLAEETFTRHYALTFHGKRDDQIGQRLAVRGIEGPFSWIEVEPVNSLGDYGHVVFGADNRHVVESGEHGMLSPLRAWLVDTRLGIPLHELYSRISERGRRQTVRDLVAAVVPGLDVLEILTDNENPRLHLTFGDHSVPVALAGDGVQALVRTCLEFATSFGGTLLLEEPEAHQHPAAIQQSARAIVEGVRGGTQVILSTHSLELVDALVAALHQEELGMLSLYRLKLAGGVLQKSRIEGPAVQRSRDDIGDDLR
jgi:predicted ATPase